MDPAAMHITETMSLELLAAVEPLLGEEDPYWIKHFIDHGEYGVAYETLVDLLIDRKLIFDDDVKQRFLSLAVRMKIDSEPDVRRFLASLSS